MKHLFPILALAILMPACSLNQRIDRVSADIERLYSQTRLWEQLPQRTISWQQAIAMMRRQNPQLLAAQARIEHEQREELSVYTDMIPGVSYYSYFNKSLQGLTQTLSSDDVQTTVNINFYLPTLTRVPYKVYSAKASAYAAIKAKEGKEQELISKLYTAVRTRGLRQRQLAHEKKSAVAAADNNLPAPPNFEAENSDLEYWKQISAILGDSSARWNILPSGVPTFRWSHYNRKMNQLSELMVCQHALKLEQARLAQYGVAMEYLPTINTSMYSPSLFSSTGGTYSGTFLDLDDTTLNLSLSYTLDTKLENWYTYKDNKARYEQVSRDVLRSLLEHKQKMALLRRSMNEYFTWRSYMQKRMDFIRNSPADTPADFLEREQELHRMQSELLAQEEKVIESEAALVLEYGLK
ncbi:MAG: TolC family protein [Akkermansia sp.]|nr:TolC family protein [Akkermansia sp.]